MAKDESRIASSLDALFSARAVDRRHFLAAGAALAGAGIAAPGPAAAEAASATEADRRAMAQAIELMRKAGVVEKTGGPFGAVIVRDGEVLAASGNSVLRDSDPSAHAEVNAIRIACRKVGAPNLSGATLFTSCEPCPMCYATAYWARIGRIYYAAAWTDYADLFDDQNISQDMKRPYAERAVPVSQMMQAEARTVWLEYRQMPEKRKY
ncbi:nucleoside deaminase [Methylobacterium dankookense]|uniref:Guanine deaminase n=1 Tax=Methylobacterium dankookense TaxID=560405 RepID=A0A564G1M5_9HYPH|nr:nucleoside deaminase [Methylobacterium dankookense]GJD58616.1 tRNA-specific adenosine deaminase [Methylobacterium dankookense]VUF14024.1 Guanine deaminase [Methylobacterium dankookense]